MTVSEGADKFGNFLLNKERSMFLRAFSLWFAVFGAMLVLAVVVSFFAMAVEFLSLYVSGYVLYNIFIWGFFFVICCWIVGKKEKS